MIKFTTELKAKSIDILINNAGINKIDLIEELNINDLKRIQTVNVVAPMMLMGAVLPGMRSRGWGRVLNISSIYGVIAKEQRSAYSASKNGIIGATKVAALEFAPHNILINALSPGYIDTDLTREVLGLDGIEKLRAAIPMGRLGDPKDIAMTALFLVSNLNTYLTGQNIIVDGGVTIA